MDDGDCLGVSSGDPDTELEDEAASELRVACLVSGTPRGIAVVDMMGTPSWYVISVECCNFVVGEC